MDFRITQLISHLKIAKFSAKIRFKDPSRQDLISDEISLAPLKVSLVVSWSCSALRLISSLGTLRLLKPKGRNLTQKRTRKLVEEARTMTLLTLLLQPLSLKRHPNLNLHQLTQRTKSITEILLEGPTRWITYKRRFRWCLKTHLSQQAESLSYTWTVSWRSGQVILTVSVILFARVAL